MKYKIKAVLFDLDGVIVRTDQYHYMGWKRLADEEGWQFDPSVNEKLRGVSRLASLEIILDHNGIELPLEKKIELANRKNGYYVEFLRNINDGDVIPGSVDFLKSLKDKGAMIALCSSSKNAFNVVDTLGLTPLFDTIVTGADIKNTKPDPEIFLLAADRLGVHPVHCLVFEDADAGVKGAVAANMKCIGVGTPEDLPDALETIRSYSEIDVDALLASGHKQYPACEPWAIIEKELNPRRSGYWESIFSLTNGYMGLRGTHNVSDPVWDECANPGMFVNGIYEFADYQFMCSFKGFPKRGHGITNLFDWRVMDISIDGEKFELSSGKVLEYERKLDLKAGVVLQSILWESTSGKRVKIESTRLVSMTRKHSAAINTSVTAVNFSGCIEFCSRVEFNPKSNIIRNWRLQIESRIHKDDIDLVQAQTATSKQHVAAGFGYSFIGGNNTAGELQVDDKGFSRLFKANAAQGETVTLSKYACFYDSLENSTDEILALCESSVRQDASDGFASLAAEQSEFWANYWSTGDIEIGTDPMEQAAMRFCLFNLRQSVPDDGLRSISATGQTSDGYSGHIFWDTEMYIVPNILYTEPEKVRPLLMYRYNLLDMARKRAKELDGKGALYAWNSINGEECGFIYEASTAEYHINSDIAYAIDKYVSATDDRDFLYKHGAEMIFETARFMYSLGKFVPLRGNKFCINVVCGPDEYNCGVDNNCYTNSMAQFHFNYAADVYKEMALDCPDMLKKLCEKIGLEESEISAWLTAADNMYIPWIEEMGIHAQDDSYIYRDPVDMSRTAMYTDIRFEYHPLNLWRLQLTKQADVVLLMFVLGDKFSKDIKRANYEFYEPRTNHGSSLSPSMHSIIAAEIGRNDDMVRYFRDSAFMDLFDVKNNTKAGIHSASLGGTWMALVNGIAGMRDYAGGLQFDPKIPEDWSYYKFNINLHGSLISVRVDSNEVNYSLMSGNGISLKSGNSTVELSQDSPSVVVPLESMAVSGACNA